MLGLLAVGQEDGDFEGVLDGSVEGVIEGRNDGEIVGRLMGAREGKYEGALEGGAVNEQQINWLARSEVCVPFVYLNKNESLTISLLCI